MYERQPTYSPPIITRMDTPELVIWSAMLGALVALAGFAIVDALIRRSIAAWRSFVFVIVTGTVCVLLTGLVPTLLPNFPQTLIHVLQNSLGLLSGALSLSYLGLWLGRVMEDRLVRIAINLGTVCLVLAAGTMAILTLTSAPEQWHELLIITAMVNALAVLPPTIATVRAIALGDRLARGMLAVDAMLAVMVAGLYGRALHINGLGTGVWILTAICTVAFFMLGTYLGLRRDRINRKLVRLASLAQGDDPATGLPKGSILLSKVDDAIWRSARMDQECTVICVHLRNLYELAEIAGHNADQQILSAMSARLRRAIGFTHVLGLYHPRCFVLVISTYSQTRLVDKTVQRLRYLLTKPLRIVGLDDSSHTFVPRIGIGLVQVAADNADPAGVIEQAERLSLATGQDSGNSPSVNATLA